MGWEEVGREELEWDEDGDRVGVGMACAHVARIVVCGLWIVRSAGSPGMRLCGARWREMVRDGARWREVGLNWHVRQAQQPGVSVDQDELLMSVLAHDNGAIRRQGVIGIGVGQLLAAADECDKKGEHLKSAYMFAAVGGQGTAGSAELLHARVRFTLKPWLLDIVHLLC